MCKRQAETHQAIEDLVNVETSGDYQIEIRVLHAYGGEPTYIVRTGGSFKGNQDLRESLIQALIKYRETLEASIVQLLEDEKIA